MLSGFLCIVQALWNAWVDVPSVTEIVARLLTERSLVLYFEEGSESYYRILRLREAERSFIFFEYTEPGARKPIGKRCLNEHEVESFLESYIEHSKEKLVSVGSVTKEHESVEDNLWLRSEISSEKFNTQKAISTQFSSDSLSRFLMLSLFSGLLVRSVSATASPTSQPTASLPVSLKNGLVAYYPFDGNANDASANGNNAVVNSATLTTDRFGNTGSAYSFSGSSSFIQVPGGNFNFNFNMSVAFWIKPSGIQYSWARTIQKYVSSYQSGWLIDQHSSILNSIGFNSIYQVGSISTTSYSQLSTSNWQHVSYVKQGALIKCYLNGVLKSNQFLSGASMVSSGSTPLLFGGRFNGTLDDIFFYDRPLSSTEISSLYSLTVQPTSFPSNAPTFSPTNNPTAQPSNQPTFKPSLSPTLNPSVAPTTQPTAQVQDIDLNFFQASQGIKITGLSGGFGFVVDRCDLNGDHKPDIIVSAPYANSNVGMVSVIYGGQNQNVIDASNLTPQQGFRIYGDPNIFLSTGYAKTGTALSCIGDFNKDGFEDFSIAAVGNAYSAGRAYVIFGNRTNNDVHLGNLTLSQGFYVTRNTGTYQLGFSISRVGDVNQDGYHDLLIGEVYAEHTAFLIFGRKSGWQNLDVSNLNSADGIAFNNFCPDTNNYCYGGYSVSGLGDVNGDGYPDMVVGAPRWGYLPTSFVSIIYGSSTMSSLNLLSTPVSKAFRISGLPYDRLGNVLSGSGDFDGDGFSDILIGAPFATSNQYVAYLIYGNKTNPYLNTTRWDSSRGMRFSRSSNDGTFTTGFLSWLGDLNGDGLSDIGISSITPTGMKRNIYVIFGSKNRGGDIQLGSISPSQGYQIYGTVGTASNNGYRLGSVGDFNGDGYSDFAVGDPDKNVVYIIYGNTYQTSPPSVQPSASPTRSPTAPPTVPPTRSPSRSPSSAPTLIPTFSPTILPSLLPTLFPTMFPTFTPSFLPSFLPTRNPSIVPSLIPTVDPTFFPSSYPTYIPTYSPTRIPTVTPSIIPTWPPTIPPTFTPSENPSFFPSGAPSSQPSGYPTSWPSFIPSFIPSKNPSFSPSAKPTFMPIYSPSFDPTSIPSFAPSFSPTNLPTYFPSQDPSFSPTAKPTLRPTAQPTSVRTIDRSVTIAFAGSESFTFQSMVYHENADYIIVTTEEGVCIIKEFSHGSRLQCDLLNVGLPRSNRFVLSAGDVTYFVDEVDAPSFSLGITPYNPSTNTYGAVTAYRTYFAACSSVLVPPYLVVTNDQTDVFNINIFRISPSLMFRVAPQYQIAGLTPTQIIFCGGNYLVCQAGYTIANTMLILQLDVSQLSFAGLNAMLYTMRITNAQAGEWPKFKRLALTDTGDVVGLMQLNKGSQMTRSGYFKLNSVNNRFVGVDWAWYTNLMLMDVLAIRSQEGNGVLLMCAAYAGFDGAPQGNQLVMVAAMQDTGEMISMVRIVSLFPAQGQCQLTSVGTRGVTFGSAVLLNDGRQAGLFGFVTLVGGELRVTSLPLDVQAVPLSDMSLANITKATLTITSSLFQLLMSIVGYNTAFLSVESAALQVSVNATLFALSQPSFSPTASPSALPTLSPSFRPTGVPSRRPTFRPSERPSVSPTKEGWTNLPTSLPSLVPSSLRPTRVPSVRPSWWPSIAPSWFPTRRPSPRPSLKGETNVPTSMPSLQPSRFPSSWPSFLPTFRPSFWPTLRPSVAPTRVGETNRPTVFWTFPPSSLPTVKPSSLSPTISNDETFNPTSYPSFAEQPVIVVSSSVGSAPHELSAMLYALIGIGGFSVLAIAIFCGFYTRFFGSSGISLVCSNKEQITPDEFGEKGGDSRGFSVSIVEGAGGKPLEFRKSRFFAPVKVQPDHVPDTPFVSPERLVAKALKGVMFLSSSKKNVMLKIADVFLQKVKANEEAIANGVLDWWDVVAVFYWVYDSFIADNPEACLDPLRGKIFAEDTDTISKIADAIFGLYISAEDLKELALDCYVLNRMGTDRIETVRKNIHDIVSSIPVLPAESNSNSSSLFSGKNRPHSSENVSEKSSDDEYKSDSTESGNVVIRYV